MCKPEINFTLFRTCRSYSCMKRKRFDRVNHKKIKSNDLLGKDICRLIVSFIEVVYVIFLKAEFFVSYYLY